jgi:hypothetical protein
MTHRECCHTCHNAKWSPRRVSLYNKAHVLSNNRYPSWGNPTQLRISGGSTGLIVIETSGRLHPWPQNKRLCTMWTTYWMHTRQDNRRIQTELAFTLAKNATKPNPFEIISLQTTRKEINLKTEDNVGESSCNCGDGTDQRVQSLRLMMMMMMMMMTIQQLYVCHLPRPVRCYIHLYFLKKYKCSLHTNMVDNTTFYILHTKIHGNYPTLPHWENLFYWRQFILRKCRHTKMWKEINETRWS